MGLEGGVYLYKDYTEIGIYGIIFVNEEYLLITYILIITL